MERLGNEEGIKEEMKEDIKARIFESALALFREKGIKFTMDDVAKNLGISKKTLYLVVRDKEALLNEMVDYGFNLIKEAERKRRNFY